MEVPRYWREMPIKIGFVGKEVGADKGGFSVFKYPGGSIPLSGSYEEILHRFNEKGFKPEVVEKILFNIFNRVASEPAVSFEKIVNSQNELVRTEVGEQNRGEVELRVNSLPGKITRKSLFASCTNN